MDWLNVSAQSTYNWAARRTGPPRRMTKGQRSEYRLADALHWLEGVTSPSADQRIRTYIASHEAEAARATVEMAPEIGQWIRTSIVRLPSLTTAELDRLCSTLDRSGFRNTLNLSLKV